MPMQGEIYRTGKQPCDRVGESQAMPTAHVLRELEIFTLICALGFLVTIWLYLKFADFGELAETLEQFL